MIEDSIIRQILECWAASENPRFGDGIQRPLPSFHDVKDVFEQVFLASLKCEEGRPIRCSLVLASPSDIDDPSHQYNKDFRRFVTPAPIDRRIDRQTRASLRPDAFFNRRLQRCRDENPAMLGNLQLFPYSAPLERALPRPSRGHVVPPGPVHVDDTQSWLHSGLTHEF